MTAPYTVEGWANGSVVGWRRYVRPTAAYRFAQHLTIDRHADVVWFYRDGVAVGYLDGMWFRKTRGDDQLEAAIVKADSGE